MSDDRTPRLGVTGSDRGGGGISDEWVGAALGVAVLAILWFTYRSKR